MPRHKLSKSVVIDLLLPNCDKKEPTTIKLSRKMNLDCQIERSAFWDIYVERYVLWVFTRGIDGTWREGIGRVDSRRGHWAL